MEEVLNVPDPLSELKYECGICLRDFTSSLCLQTHIETHKNDTHSCPQCGMSFPGFPELDDHLTSFHADANVSELTSTDEDTKVPVEELDEGLSLNTKNPHSGDNIWSIDPRDLPTEGNSLKVNLGKYPSDCNESLDTNQSDYQQKKSLKFSCRICHLYFENRNHLLRHLKLTNNLVSKEDHLTLDAESNKKSPRLIQRNKRGMNSLNESNKTSLGCNKPRCRVCKVELPQCKKLRRAHIRKHLLVKLNKRVYHVWKYLKTPKKEGLKSDVKKANFLETFKKPSIGNYEAFDVTPPVSDEDGGGNKHCSDLSNYRPREFNGQDTGLKKGKQPNILLRCFLCGDKFTTKTGLENHFQIVHGDRKSFKEVKPLPHNKMSSWFTCSACGKKVHGKEKFESHLTEHSFKHDLLKQKCNSDFAAGKSTSPNKGSKHFSKGPWFTCTECGKLCKGKKFLQDHAKKFHGAFGNEEKDQIPSKSSPWRRCCKKPSCAWYVCNTCSERFKGKARINSHILTCSSVINEDVNLELHPIPIDIGRRVPLPISTLPHCSWFACELCKVKVHGRKRMIQHYEVCQGGKDTTHKMQRSIYTHENLELKPDAIQVTPGTKHDTTFNPQFTKYKCGPWFRCLECNKLIKGKSNLKTHQHSTRTGKQKLLQTEIFDQTLPFSSQSGVKFFVCWCWYSCQICGLKIRGKKNANLHRHSEEMLNSSRNMKPQGELQMTCSSSSLISQANAVSDYDLDMTYEETTAVGKDFPLPKFVQHGVWYRCQTCPVAVRGKKAMMSHSHGASVGKDKNNLADSAAMLNNNWTCNLCTKCFVSKKSLLLHMKNHTECQEYKCGHCNKVFLTKSGFKLHQHIYGKEHSLVPQDKSTEDQLQNHQKTNADDKFYIVNDEPLGANGTEQTNVMEFQGKKVGETSSDLPPLDFYGKLDNNDGRKTKESEKCSTQARDHTLSANPSQPDIENKVDSAVFENRRNDAESKNNRDGEKSDLQCTTCGFTAASAASLKRHQTNKHTFSPVTARSIKKNINQYVSSDGRTYQCDICAKQFESKKVVKEHVRQHIVKQYMSGHGRSGATQNSFSDSRMINDDDRGESEDEVMLIEETSNQQNKYQSSRSCIPSISEVGSFDGQTSFELFENKGRTKLSQNRELKKSSSVVTRMRSKRREDEGSFNFTSDHCFEAEENSFRVTGEQRIKRDVESSKANPGNDIPQLVKLEFFCQVCFKSFATNMMASEHVLSHYAENSEMKSQGPSPASQLVCEVCGQTFRSTKEWRNHEENHSQEEIHKAQNKCLECNLSFKNKQLLTKHLSFHHYVYLKCPQCCSFFIDHAFLNLHILRKRHFLCDCGQLFLTFQALDQHRNIGNC